jgi:hypothetical protein
LTQTLLPRARAGLALAGLATGLVAAGCGSSSTGGNSNADPASITPASAPLYASLVVRPEGDQKTELEAVLKKVMRTDDPGAKITKLFDDSAKKSGVTYEKDVKPWLGKRAGVFLTSITSSGDSDYAVVLPTSDQGKALDALRKGDKGIQKRSYQGVDYEVNDEKTATAKVGDDFVVAGTEPGLKAAIDTSKDSSKAITKDDDFTKASSEAGTDSLATLYLDPGSLFDALARNGSIDRQSVTALRQALSSAGVRAVGMGADANSQGFTATFATIGSKTSSVEGGDGPGALAELPGDSWLGIGIGNLGGQIDNVLKQAQQLGGFAGVDLNQIFDQLKQQSGLDIRADLIDWMGDTGLFVRGTSVGDIGGGLVVKSKDPVATARGIKRIARLLRKQGTTVTPVGGNGIDTGVSFKISSLDAYLVIAGDKFVGAVGRGALDAALKPTSKLGDSPGFQQAASQLGQGLKPSVFFAMEPVLQLADSAGAGSSASWAKVEPYLKAFTTIVAGGKRSGDVGKGRIVIGVR